MSEELGCISFIEVICVAVDVISLRSHEVDVTCVIIVVVFGGSVKIEVTCSDKSMTDDSELLQQVTIVAEVVSATSGATVGGNVVVVFAKLMELVDMEAFVM